VLAARAPEGEQDVALRVVPLPHRDLPDRLRHPFVGDAQQAREQPLARHRLAGGGEARLQGGAGALGGADVERDLEARRIEPAEEEVDVGEAERPAGAVAGRPGPGAAALRSDPQPPPVERADRASARRHRLHRDRGSQQPRLADAMLEHPRQRPVPPRHVGARAAHVEADDAREAAAASRLGGAHDPGRRPRQQPLVRAEAPGGDEAPGAGHDEDRARIGAGPTASAERAVDAPQVPLEDGCEVGVDERRLRACQVALCRRQRG
jgi:hypothetical protein